MTEPYIFQSTPAFRMARITESDGSYTWMASVGNIVRYGFASAADAYAWMKERLMQ